MGPPQYFGGSIGIFSFLLIFSCLLLFLMYRKSRWVIFYLKLSLAGIITFSCYFVTILLYIPLRICGYSREAIAEAGTRAPPSIFFPLIGWKFEIENEHIMFSKRPCVFVLNHQSALDILISGLFFRAGDRCMAKKSLKYFPILNIFFWIQEVLFVERRGNQAAARQVIESAVQLLKNGKSVGIFPEGHRSPTPDLLPFKKGAFHIAVKARRPIVPIVISNTRVIFDAKKKIFSRGKVVIRILNPVETDTIDTSPESIERLKQQVFDVMKQELSLLNKIT